ncbi:hypothetical protein DV738_g2393, partial [Chaetothyriales sp. CBS 135597]
MTTGRQQQTNHQIHQVHQTHPIHDQIQSQHLPSSNVVRSLNAAIDRAAHVVLPHQPYLVSVPSDVPYRHSARFVPTWFVGTPFDRSEEQLQYLSFLPHQDEEEELLRVVGGWSDSHGSLLDDRASAEPRSTAAGDSISSSNNHDDDSHGRHHHSDHATTPRASVRKKISLRDYNKVSTKAADLAVRHKHDSPAPNQAPSSAAQHPHKKRKLSPPETAATTKPLPLLLSPTLPSQRPKNELPDLLSPLLPPSLIKAIAAQPEASNDNSSGNARHSTPLPDGGSPVGAQSARSAASPSPVPVPVPPQPQPRPPANKPVAALAKPAAPNRVPAHSPRPRQRHVIALKYGKKNRKRVEALLKFAPRPKKIAPSSDSAEARNARDAHAPTTTATAMSRDKSSDASAKAKPAAAIRDAPSQIKRPSTPLPKIKEATANTVGNKKPLHATPKKEFKSSAMRRVESVEGVDPCTPTEKGRGSTPSSAGGPALASRKASPGPTSVPQSSHEDRHTWQDMHQTYFALGRSIKHNATDDHKRGSPAYAVRLVEALLAFMISYAAQTLSRPTCDVWTNITDYFNFVLGGTDDFRSLHGLVLQLGAVCRQQIQKDRLDRLARDPLPDEYVGSAPTPGSDGTAKTAEDAERYKNEYVRNRTRMIRNAHELEHLWFEGSKRLSPELLRNDYPKTWHARRGYFLPLDATASPFEAVRYGLAFLTEWADVHSLHWKPRINLDHHHQPSKTVPLKSTKPAPSSQ